MAPFAWQSNKSYPFLLHLKLCLHLCILHQWTEAKFQQQCVWEECLSGAVLFICQAHSVCRMVQVTTLSVQRPWDFAAAKEWSISSYQAVPKVGSVVCFFFYQRLWVTRDAWDAARYLSKKAGSRLPCQHAFHVPFRRSFWLGSSFENRIQDLMKCV